MNKKICFITGTRAEYGLLKTIIEEIKKDKKFEIQIIATGMHLSPQFGMTVNDIVNDGFKINSRVIMTPKEDSKKAMAESIGVGIIGLTNSLVDLKPDFVVVLGDRVEALAGAISAYYSNITLIHIHGGDSSKGGLDENTRHAITKLSHIHFPVSRKSAERIIKLGENEWRVHIIGAPGLDDIQAGNFTKKEEVLKKYKLSEGEPIIILVQHPVTTQIKLASQQISASLEAISSLGYQTVIVYPNSDAGGRQMIETIQTYLEKNKFLKGYKNIPRSDYLGLLNIASVLVGNSSSGIIESPSLHLPVVDIGLRQEGREQSTNLVHVDSDTDSIKRAIKYALSNEVFLSKVKTCVNPYWYGGAGKKMASVLSNLQIDDKFLQKKITY